jgi:hypothetical protein
MVITKHHRTKERKTHTKPLFCCCVLLFFYNFFKGTSKLNIKTKMLLMRTDHTHSLSLRSMYGLIRFKQKVYSDWGSKGLLGLKQKLYSYWNSKGLLGLKQKLYSDWCTRSNQTRKYYLHQQGVYNNE